MTNPTPRDSAQLPPLPAPDLETHQFIDGTARSRPVWSYSTQAVEQIVSEALRAQAASPADMAVYQGIADGYQRDAQAASVEPVDMPTFHPVAQRKLSDLQQGGFHINGYSIQNDATGQKGFITDGGFVGWWFDERAPQAAQQAAQATAGWQPIETAPKDGRAILVSDGRFVFCVEWNEEFDWWGVDDNKLGPFRLRGAAPTHWQPLPAPPAALPQPQPQSAQAKGDA